MNTLVVYDATGRVLIQLGGTTTEPVGIPFMWVDVPEGKYVENIDVSSAEHIPVFSDLPKSEIQVLQEQINELIIALGDALLNGGV